MEKGNGMRQAKCQCGKVVPSKESLPFFESKDAGSRLATIQCKHCVYHDAAHNKGHKLVCDNFTPHGAFQYDSFYCGCNGWD